MLLIRAHVVAHHGTFSMPLAISSLSSTFRRCRMVQATDQCLSNLPRGQKDDSRQFFKLEAQWRRPMQLQIPGRLRSGALGVAAKLQFLAHLAHSREGSSKYGIRKETFLERRSLEIMRPAIPSVP